MAFNNMDIDSWKTLFDLCLEQIDRDVDHVVDVIVREVDAIVREVEEDNENRDYGNIPDLNESYDDHSSSSNDSIDSSSSNDSIDSSSSNDSIETSVESSVLPQVVVSVETSGSGLPQDNLPVSVESSENYTLRFETLDIDQKQKDSLNSISQKLGGVGKEAEDINQELQIIKDQSNLLMDFEVILDEILKEIWELEKSCTGCRFIMARVSRSFFILTGQRHENNGDDGSQDNLYESHEQKQKYWLNIYQQLEGACMEIEDIIQELQIIRETSIMDMDIELLKEEILDPAHQRRENLSKLVQDIEKEVALEDNLPVSVESSENDTLRFETLDIDQKQKDSLNSISQKLGGVGKEAEDINQELQIIKDQSNLLMDFEVILDEILKEIWELEKSCTGCRFIMARVSRSFFILTGQRFENNGDDGSQDNLYESHEQKQKYWLNIYQQLEGTCMEIEDIIQELQIIRETSIMDMDIELLKEEILDPAHKRRENLSKLVQDIEKEVALEDQKNRRKADSYLQELEESITEESDEENDSSNEENDPVTAEMYYSCDSDPWDTMSDISDYGSCSVDTIWDRMLAKSPDFCVDNKVASEKSTEESDGNEAWETEYSVPLNSPEEIKHGDEMSSAWRNPIIISSSSSDPDADINISMESDMEDIHLTDDEFEQTWEFINPGKVHSIPNQQQKERSIKKRFLSYFGGRKMVADNQSA